MLDRQIFVNGFRFIREITPFNLSEFQVLVNWKYNPKPFAIYTHSISSYYYLHDEALNKLYEVETAYDVDIIKIDPDTLEPITANLLLTTYKTVFKDENKK